nr:homeobox protein NANOG isoform X3 [Pelodiscus sinensis]|eukprot:XP_006119991.1 homeobox protein NANOG isoform X3 [Pelodiscus sinensis]
MSAHLAMPAYQAYPAGVGTGIKYGDYYWNCPGEMDSAPHKEAADADVAVPEPEEKPLPNPELSPASSSSGTLLRYTPDSATSPNAAPPSPHPAIRMGGGGSGGGVKKAKTRTAFSQEQLQTLHQRFQSQKYLSPQQIRELGSALGLTYKQVKTWFQNQRMKFKRCQKETQWMEKGTCLSQQPDKLSLGSKALLYKTMGEPRTLQSSCLTLRSSSVCDQHSSRISWSLQNGHPSTCNRFTL